MILGPLPVRTSDLLLLLPVLLAGFALRAVRRGDQRRHGHLMAAAVALVGVYLLTGRAAIPPTERVLGLGWLGLAVLTLLLGRQALAWREGRTLWRQGPRVHRALGVFTLVSAVLLLLAGLLRSLG